MHRSISSLLLVLIALAAPGFAQSRRPQQNLDGQIPSYFPIEPISLPRELIPQKGGSNQRCLTIRELPLLKVNASLLETRATGKAQYLLVAFSTDNSSYTYYYDYMSYANVTVQITIVAPAQDARTQNGQPAFVSTEIPVTLSVGVGVRALASFKAHSGGAKVNDLVYIGAAASNHEIFGDLSITTIGIIPKIAPEFTFQPSTLSTDSTQRALVGIGATLSKLHEPGTDIHPHIFGCRVWTLPPGTTHHDVITALHRNKEAVDDQLIKHFRGASPPVTPRRKT